MQFSFCMLSYRYIYIQLFIKRPFFALSKGGLFSFYKGGKMEKIETAGMNFIGNISLLEKPLARIGVFASRSQDIAIDIIREQWAIAKGRQHKCIAGPFHSKAEIEILYFVLKYGGTAIWFMGCALPKELPQFAQKCVKKGKLLIVSCFHQKHHNIYTARYCCHLTDMTSNRLAFFSRSDKSIHTFIYERAQMRKKWVESF